MRKQVSLTPEEITYLNGIMTSALEIVAKDLLCYKDKIDTELNKVLYVDLGKNCLGQCVRHTPKYARPYFNLYFNTRYFLQKDIPLATLQSTVIHEVLHLITNNEGHTGEWKRLANLITEKHSHLGIKILRCASLEDIYTSEQCEMIRDKTNKSVYKYAVQCPKCKEIIYRKRMCDLIKYPELYWHTTCGKDNKFIRLY